MTPRVGRAHHQPHRSTIARVKRSGVGVLP
jgi:hypothetical protein